MSLLNEIPGYAAAVNAEQTVRELAYQATPPPVCGIPIRHLNARHFMVLAGCRNPFVVGGIVKRGDVAFWFWVLSPEYCTDTTNRDRFIRKNVSRLNYQQACAGINMYMQGALQDWPAGRDTGEKSYTAWISPVVDLLGMEYGWSCDQILEMPLAVIFQQMKRIARRKDPKAVLFNPSDQVLSQNLISRLTPANN